MALVAEPRYVVTATFKDRDNNKGSFSFNLNSSLSNLALEEAALDIAAAGAGVSNALLVGLSINRSYVETTNIAAQAPEASDVERKAVYVFQTDEGQTVTVQIPSVDNTKVVDGTNILNPADAAVLAFSTLFLDTGLGAANSPITVSGEDLTSLARPAYKRHRNSSKG